MPSGPRGLVSHRHNILFRQSLIIEQLPGSSLNEHEPDRVNTGQRGHSSPSVMSSLTSGNASPSM